MNAQKLVPEVLSFLSRLVDRLDAAEQRGATKAQSVPLTAKTWPELVNASFESDKEALWSSACDLHRRGWIRLTPESAARSPFGYSHEVRISVLDADVVRRAVGRLERAKTAVERWREAVEGHLHGSPSVRKAVSSYLIELPGREMAEIVAKLNELPQLQDRPLLLREVSARLFWGMSKVLDGRQGLVAAVLDRDDCPFPESPVQMLVQLPVSEFTGVLFIENQMSFEQAARSQSPWLDGFSLAFASGFKGSAQRLRSSSGASIYYSSRGASSPQAIAAFETWLFSCSEFVPVFFWGDLDWSGMSILRAMRSSFHRIEAWQPGYKPMLNALLMENGHSPISADKAGQQVVVSTGCLYADEYLLPALRHGGTFVDQEFFTL